MPHLRVRASCRSARFLLIVGAFAAFLAPARLDAQIVMNPSVVSFIPSDDHNATTASGQPSVTQYEFEVFVAGAAQPIAVVSLGKPSPAADGNIYANFIGLLLSPLRTGVPLEARVAAVGPEGRGESTPSNLFEFDAPAPLPTPAPSPTPTTSAPGHTSGAGGISLSITAPIPREAFNLGEAVTVVAKITGRVSGVDFYVNGRPIGTAARSPYAVKWKGRSTGTYTFTAVTVDVNGVQLMSAPVTVIVGRSLVAPRTPPAGGPIIGKAKDRG
ncbi:MAG: Ig-like domain-containing protein, partial [Bacteroidales bacterium]